MKSNYLYIALSALMMLAVPSLTRAEEGCVERTSFVWVSTGPGVFDGYYTLVRSIECCDPDTGLCSESVD